MKFGKQIRFIAVKEWWDHYVQYKHFKEMIRDGTIKIQNLKDSGKSTDEISAAEDSLVENVLQSLYSNINAITSFYVEQYMKVKENIEEINFEIEERLSESGIVLENDHSFQKRVCGEAITLYELRTFLEVNRTGCQKIVKKLSKRVNRPSIAEEYIDTEIELFGNLPHINSLMVELDEQYVTIRRKLESEVDKRSRPEIVNELHDTIEKSLSWKESTVLNTFDATHFWRSEISMMKLPMKKIPVIISIVLLVAFSVTPFTPSFSFTAQKCVGIIAFASTLWATGAIPLWLTSLCVPLLSVILDVIPGVEELGKVIQQSTMSSNVFLTMGGFTIAAALRETEMDKRIATVVLKKASSSPKVFLLVLSLLNAFIAMWISNITSTMIVVTIVAPTLKLIPFNSNYAKAMLFSIAVGGNLGGMMTPLSSPQNAVTVEAVAVVSARYDLGVSVNFTEFFATAAPFAIFCALIAWVIILYKYPIDITAVPTIPDVKTDFGWRQITVSVVVVATIGVWIALPFGLDRVFSDFGIVGLIPIIVFYSIGILSPTMISELPWNIIFLLMGGSVLGRIVRDSGLMTIVSQGMTSILGDMNLWVTLLVVNLCVVVIDFFLTHTVSSLVTMPIIAEFGAHSGHLALFAMSACMTTTASQILPVSSFPNMCTASLQDDAKREYLKSSDVIKWGLTITAVCLAAVMTVHFGIGLAYGM